MRKFILHVLTTTDFRFRSYAGLLVAPFLLYATFFGATANIIALPIAMAILYWQAPSLRTKALALPISQAVSATFFLLISLGIMAYLPLSFSWLGLQKVFPFLATLRMFSFKMPRLAKAPPEPTLSALTEIKAEKPLKDPNRPMTNTRRKWLAKQAKTNNK